MAEFKSKFLELTFFIDGTPHKFSNGTFSTEDKKTIEVISKFRDVSRVDTKAAVEKPEDKPKAKKPKAKTSEK